MKVNVQPERGIFMAIKIIQHGRLRKCACFNCGCIFSFEREDTTKEELVGILEYATCVECPECEERNIISL